MSSPDLSTFDLLKQCGKKIHIFLKQSPLFIIILMFLISSLSVQPTKICDESEINEMKIILNGEREKCQDEISKLIKDHEEQIEKIVKNCEIKIKEYEDNKEITNIWRKYKLCYKLRRVDSSYYGDPEFEIIVTKPCENVSLNDIYEIDYIGRVNRNQKYYYIYNFFLNKYFKTQQPENYWIYLTEYQLLLINYSSL